MRADIQLPTIYRRVVSCQLIIDHVVFVYRHRDLDILSDKYHVHPVLTTNPQQIEPMEFEHSHFSFVTQLQDKTYFERTFYLHCLHEVLLIYSSFVHRTGSQKINTIDQ